PQDASGQKTSSANSNGQGLRQSSGNGNGNGGNNPAAKSGNGESHFAPPTAPILDGQTRIIWVLGQDGQLQSRRIKVGLTDGAATEVVEGNLQEGEMVITGQTLSSASKSNSNQTSAPGFGSA